LADALKNTTEEQRGVIAHHTVCTKAAQLRPTSSCSRGPSPDIATQEAEGGARDDKKRRKQCRQETATEDDGSIKKRAGGFSRERIMEVTDNIKHRAWPPLDHFKKVLTGACPSHTNPIKPKLRDYDLMKSFMTLGALS
jgi:hypothetical protein